MKIRGHGPAVAVVLSVLALAVAGGGTAVAVSSSVNIADPSTPSRVAKVDAGGRLAVSGAQSTLDSSGYLLGYADATTTFVTSPTTATLAISRITFSNPTANTTATEQQLLVGRYGVTAGGACDSGAVPSPLGTYNLAPGDDVVDALPAPIVVAPTGGARYCIGVRTNYLGDAAGIPVFYLAYGVTAFVTSGTYTGLGAPGSAPVRPNVSAKIGG